MPNPTPEQSEIVSFAAGRKENLIISALAGTGKTSTLVQLSDAVRTPTLSIAFNKRIAEELSTRMPSHVDSKTLHSVGYGLWRKFLGKGLRVDNGKVRTILRGLIDELPPKEKEEAWNGFRDMTDALEQGASSGWLPDGKFPHARPLLSDADFFSALPFAPSRLEERLIVRTATESMKLALTGTIDYNDMVLGPAVYPVPVQPYPLTLVDEAQDLSLLNHRLVEKLVGRNRLVAVGDPCQAIYAFRGAHETSMDLLRTKFEMHERPLTMAFRCPRAVVEHVLWRAPAMRSPDWAKPGTVTTLTEWGAAAVPDSAFIVCRNNAPLLSLAMRLLRAGRRPKILGNDITKGLVAAMKKLSKDPRLPRDEALALFESYAKDQRRRYRDSDYINDKLACIEHFLLDQETLGLAWAKAEQIMNAEGPIQLMTGHKSKGLEAENVFFLDEHLIKPGGQEDNLRYVICTRSQDNLTYVQSADFVEE